MNFKISVIVPVYNVENYLRKCLESILSQTYENLEVILIDDGSSDTSGIICDEYQNKDERIKVIHKENGGLSDARNVGLNNATGELIGFVDSDDFISPIMYETLYNLLISNEADIAMCQAKLFKENEICLFDTKIDKAIILKKEEALKELLRGYSINDFAWNKLYKRELFENINYPIGKKFEDIGTTYKLIDNCYKFVYTNTKLYGYLIRTNSITNDFKKSNIIDYDQMIESRYQELFSKYSDLKNYLDANRVKSIVREFQNISMFNVKEFLKERDIKCLLESNRKKLKWLNNKEVKHLNDVKVNFMATLLYLNENLFYFFTQIYYKGLKKW